MGDLVVKQYKEELIDDVLIAEVGYYGDYELTNGEWNPDSYIRNYNFNYTFNTNTLYHFYTNIQINSTKNDYNNTVFVKLKNQNNSEEQFLKEIKINNNSFYDIDIVFLPFKDGFEKISLELEKKENDYSLLDTKEIIVDEDAANGIYTLQNQFNGKKILKIGLQGNSSDIFCINGELLHLPKNGIFELNSNDLEIKSFYKPGSLKKSGDNILVTVQPFILNYIEEINN